MPSQGQSVVAIVCPNCCHVWLLTSGVEKLTRSSLKGLSNRALLRIKNGCFASRFLLLGIGFLEASIKTNLSFKSPSPKPLLNRTGSVFALPMTREPGHMTYLVNCSFFLKEVPYGKSMHHQRHVKIRGQTVTTFSHQNPQWNHFAHLLLRMRHDAWKRGSETMSLHSRFAQKWPKNGFFFVFHRGLLPNGSPNDVQSNSKIWKTASVSVVLREKLKGNN